MNINALKRLSDKIFYLWFLHLTFSPAPARRLLFVLGNFSWSQINLKLTPWSRLHRGVKFKNLLKYESHAMANNSANLHWFELHHGVTQNSLETPLCIGDSAVQAASQNQDSPVKASQGSRDSSMYWRLHTGAEASLFLKI